MIAPFEYSINASRIVFGSGAFAKVSQEISTLDCSRTMVLSTPHQRDDAVMLADKLGDQCVGVFAEAAMHTPIEITEKAISKYESLGADCVVSFGGGSTIGLGKAIAYRKDTPQIAVATTYAGSEVTPILGQTESGRKTTLRDESVLPEVVIYDPDLTLGLPVKMSVTSGLNAIAHAVEGLYARDKNPIVSLMALEGIRALTEALPVIANEPQNKGARGGAMYGSWLCGTVLGTVGMALHHKLCHALGGAFDLPHAETHAILIAHTAHYNALAAARELAPAARLFGGSIGSGIYDFAKSLGAPMALRDLGLKEDYLDRAAEIAVQNPYWNPAPVKKSAIRALLTDAWNGDRPN